MYSAETYYLFKIRIICINLMLLLTLLEQKLKESKSKKDLAL